MKEETDVDVLHDQIMQLPRFNLHTQEFDTPYRWYLRRRPRRVRRQQGIDVSLLLEMGLTLEEITALGLEDAPTQQYDPSLLTPFSLLELGLTPEEIEALGLGNTL